MLSDLPKVEKLKIRIPARSRSRSLESTDLPLSDAASMDAVKPANVGKGKRKSEGKAESDVESELVSRYASAS